MLRAFCTDSMRVAYLHECVGLQDGVARSVNLILICAPIDHQISSPRDVTGVLRARANRNRAAIECTDEATAGPTSRLGEGPGARLRAI
jgi:hypothetical protein